MTCGYGSKSSRSNKPQSVFSHVFSASWFSHFPTKSLPYPTCRGLKPFLTRFHTSRYLDSSSLWLLEQHSWHCTWNYRSLNRVVFIVFRQFEFRVLILKFGLGFQLHATRHAKIIFGIWVRLNLIILTTKRKGVHKCWDTFTIDTRLEWIHFEVMFH